MSWLRVDDGFSEHPKIDSLSEVQRWRWVVLLCMCARQAKGGIVTQTALKRIGLDTSRFLELELLDEDADGTLWVHDWDAYNAAIGSSARRQKRYRMRRAGVPEDEVMREAPVSGMAQPGDIEVERYVTEPVTRDVTPDVTRDVTTTSTPRARIPVPVPLRASNPPSVVSSEEGLNTGSELAIARLLSAVGPMEEAKVDYARGGLARLPEAVTARLLEGLAAGDVRDRAGYVLGAVRNELQEHGL